jgi:ElaB/YqjD/DUF883 family membrane-anchored ribosome-binding protein
MEQEYENIEGGGAPGSGTDPGRMGRAREFVGSKYSKVKDKVGDGYSRVRDKVGEADFEGMVEQVRTYVRSNPGKALLMSIAAGFVIGLILRRRDDDD